MLRFFQPYRLAYQERKEIVSEHLDGAIRNLTNQELLERVVKQLSLTKRGMRLIVSALDQLAGQARRLPMNAYTLFVQDHYYIDVSHSIPPSSQ